MMIWLYRCQKYYSTTDKLGGGWGIPYEIAPVKMANIA